MSNNPLFDIAVLGAGAAGQMAALRAVLNHLHTALFLGDPKTTKKSRAAWVASVENIPGMFSKKRPITTTSKETIQFIDQQPLLKPFLTIFPKAAHGIKKENGLFHITHLGETTRARFVLLCTGTMDVQPVINGSIQPILPFANMGDVLYCIRCDGHKSAGHSTAILGHKGGAAHMAITLKERYQLPEVYILTHGQKLTVSDESLSLIEKYKIQVLSEEITGILGNSKQGLQGFVLGTEQVHVTKAFIALGSLVYNELAKELGAELSPRDHVIANEYGETSVSGFYAAGDLVEGKKKQLYTAWDMAVDAVDAIDEEIRLMKRNNTY